MEMCNSHISTGQDAWTPLMLASREGHIDVVNVLLQHGASVDLGNQVKAMHMNTTIYMYLRAKWRKCRCYVCFKRHVYTCSHVGHAG